MQTYKEKSLHELYDITRDQLIGKYGVAVLANILIGLISLVTLNLVSNLSEVVNATTYIINLIITLIIDILTGILIFGRSAFFLKLTRGDNNLKVSDIFIGFKRSTDKAIIIQSIYVLVSLIAVIPSALVRTGLVPISDDVFLLFAIGLTLLQILIKLIINLFLILAFYILVDHPDYSIGKILSDSIYLMRNKKGRLLLIYLSMIPLGLIGFLSCGVGLFLVEAFYETLTANFYLDIIKEEPVSTYSDSTTSDTHL